MAQSAGSQTRGFLFSDLRDYTGYVEAHGDQAAADLLDRYRLLVREVIARFDGAEIRTEGDSFYVVFPSASAAVNGGLAILEAAAAGASGEPGRAAIRVGVGVHAGETAETPEGRVGSAVILAARMCAIAGAGELLVSDTVRGLTRTFLPVRFVPRGRRRLKGIAEPVAIYRVVPLSADARTDRAEGRQRTSRRILLLGLAAATAVVVIAAALAVAVGGIGPFGDAAGSSSSTGSHPASSGESVSATAAGAPSTAAASLSIEEEELLARLPGAIGQDCVRGTVAEGSAGGAVSLRCELAFSAGADEVWVDLFRTNESLAGAFAAESSRVGADLGDCATNPLAEGSWEVPKVHAGGLLCYQEEGGSWLLWTYDDDRILVRARRSDGSWEALYRWWRETAIFLR